MWGNGRPKGVFGESVLFAPWGLLLKHLKSLESMKTCCRPLNFPFWTTISLHDAFSAPFAHPHESRSENQKGMQQSLSPKF